MPNPMIYGKGEIDLLCNSPRIIPSDSLEVWQIEQLIAENLYRGENCKYGTVNLQSIEQIIQNWINELTIKQRKKIYHQRSLSGIAIPQEWIKVWRVILKEPDLRDSTKCIADGHELGSFTHLWNIWAQDCIDKFLSDMEKHLLYLTDMGLPYNEIGDIMVNKYGEEFWKKRKQKTKTTPAQVVNNYLYWRMPNKIARCELTLMLLKIIDM